MNMLPNLHRLHLRRVAAGIADLPRVALWIAGVLLLASSAGASAVVTSPDQLFPNPDWPVLEESAKTADLRERLEAYRIWNEEQCGERWAGVVIQHGRLIFEGRGPRSHIHQRHDCGSIKKSLQSTVLGVALYQKRLTHLDENALAYWKDSWQPPYDNDRVISFREFASYRDRWNDPEPPGTFRYNNCSAVAAGACIAGLFMEVRGTRPRGIAEIARREVMEKLGASWDLWYWEEDFSPGKIGQPGPRLVMEASASELAKLGYLWLRRGKWNGQRVFDEDYYSEAVTDWSPETGTKKSHFVGHYGYWWFVNRGKVLLPDAPEDTFYHIGNGDPKRATALLIIPSMDLVAVHGMDRLSDDRQWDVIQNSRGAGNEGMRRWTTEVLKLHATVPINRDKLEE